MLQYRIKCVRVSEWVFRKRLQTRRPVHKYSFSRCEGEKKARHAGLTAARILQVEISINFINSRCKYVAATYEKSRRRRRRRDAWSTSHTSSSAKTAAQKAARTYTYLTSNVQYTCITACNVTVLHAYLIPVCRALTCAKVCVQCTRIVRESAVI